MVIHRHPKDHGQRDSANPTNPNKPRGMMLVNYGVTDALSAFPLHSLVATMTATINNNTVAMNVADVLPAILRLMDPEELAYYLEEPRPPLSLTTSKVKGPGPFASVFSSHG